jgi:hypothetical protein
LVLCLTATADAQIMQMHTAQEAQAALNLSNANHSYAEAAQDVAGQEIQNADADKTSAYIAYDLMMMLLYSMPIQQVEDLRWEADSYFMTATTNFTMLEGEIYVGESTLSDAQNSYNSGMYDMCVYSCEYADVCFNHAEDLYVDINNNPDFNSVEEQAVEAGLAYTDMEALCWIIIAGL